MRAIVHIINIWKGEHTSRHFLCTTVFDSAQLLTLENITNSIKQI